MKITILIVSAFMALVCLTTTSPPNTHTASSQAGGSDDVVALETPEARVFGVQQPDASSSSTANIYRLRAPDNPVTSFGIQKWVTASAWRPPADDDPVAAVVQNDTPWPAWRMPADYDPTAIEGRQRSVS